MKIRDKRDNLSSVEGNKRDTLAIDKVYIHHSKIEEKDKFHYAILIDGRIEYLQSITKILFEKKSIEICLVGNFDQNKPSPLQLQALTDLISFLLIPRSSSPHLTSMNQIFPYNAIHPSSTSPGKTWDDWKGYIFGTKSFAQPQFLAEFQQQEVVLPKDKSVSLKVIFKNTGTVDWNNEGEHQATLNIAWEGGSSSAKLANKYNLTEGSSLFYDPSWLNPFSPCAMQEQLVKPGQTATFIFTLSGNNVAPGTYREDFGLAIHDRWIDNIVNGNKANKAHCWFTIEVV